MSDGTVMFRACTGSPQHSVRCRLSSERDLLDQAPAFPGHAFGKVWRGDGQGLLPFDGPAWSMCLLVIPVSRAA